MDRRNLPPLATLRVFEATARLLSFTGAAQELGMTQAAVSYQIKTLEERIGTPLFLRRPRQVMLTDAGARLLPHVSEAFAILSNAFASLSGATDKVLRISCLQTFAAQWLVRRIGSFQLKHPELALRLDTSQHLISFDDDQFDAAIRSGDGKWPGLISHRLLPVRYTAMLSPDLAKRAGGIREPADLLKLPFIDPDDPWWGQWFSAAGVNVQGEMRSPRSSLSSQYLAAEAAIAGQAAAILTPALFTTEIAAGLLVQPFETLCDSGTAYWLVYPERRRNSPKIQAFRDWLLDTLPPQTDT